MSRFKDFDSPKDVAYIGKSNDIQVRTLAWLDIELFSNLKKANQDHISNWEIRYTPNPGMGATEFGVWLGETPIGMITLWDIDKIQHVCKVSYWIDKDHCNKGYMTKALDHVLGFATTVLSIERFLAPVQLDNEASVKVLEKLNFSKLGPAVYESLDGTLTTHYIYVRNTDANL